MLGHCLFLHFLLLSSIHMFLVKQIHLKKGRFLNIATLSHQLRPQLSLDDLRLNLRVKLDFGRFNSEGTYIPDRLLSI